MDILGPTGDNIEFYNEEAAETASIGILKEDVILQEKDETHEEQKIEKGSLILQELIRETRLTMSLCCMMKQEILSAEQTQRVL